MPRSIAELCQAAYDRCEQAKTLTGDERRLYLHDAIAKLYAALDLYAEESESLIRSAKSRPVRGKEVGSPNRRRAGARTEEDRK